jgi:excisionase family DNA binding protein
MGQKITVNAAAKELGISLRGIRRLISTGELRAYRVGTTVSVRVDRDDIEALFKPVVPARH